MNIRGVAFLDTIGVILSAQTPALQIGVLYVCGPNAGFKVISCAGPGNADVCDVESQIPGQPSQRGKSPRQQVMALASICHVQTPAEAQAGARGGRRQLQRVRKPERADSRSAIPFRSTPPSAG